MKKNHYFGVFIVIASALVFAGCPLDEDPLDVGVDGVTLNETGMALYVEDQAMLTASVFPENANNKAVKWSTSDPDIAVVENGLVTAVGAGNAVITVTTAEGGFKDTCSVEVLPIIHYSQYGAVGDGVTDDFDAIIKAHAAANASGAKVKADAGMTYYIGGSGSTAVIQTNTDWGNAGFIIDDTKASGNGSWLFRVESAQASVNILGKVSALTKNQAQVNLSPPLSAAALIVATDNTTTRYIRSGSNENPGAAQKDVFIIGENGSVDMSAPILWDFNNISALTAYPIDEKQLTVTGGRFTTKADTRPSSASTGYMNRGIQVRRSNTLIDGLKHEVEGEILEVRPYNGFLNIVYCANVTVQNTVLTGRRVYNGRGTYDISSDTVVNLNVIKCSQTNDITNNTWWGIFTSNYSKNIMFNNVSFSRFDAHQGVHNTTILNSELGHQGVSIIGSGVLRIENTRVYGQNFINLRNDYGSTWEGSVTIRNGILIPGDTYLNNARIFNTSNDGSWNYGYTCFFPETIVIDGFTVQGTAGQSAGVYMINAVAITSATNGYNFNNKKIYLSGLNIGLPYRWSGAAGSGTTPASGIMVFDGLPAQ